MHNRKWMPVTVIIGSLVALTGCSAGTETNSATDSTIVWGNGGEPDTLDPAYATAGVAWVPDGQIFEGLVTTSADGLDIEPKLATSWEVDAAGTTYTFTLQEGVTFSDGTPLDAAAVCANFDRWYNFSGLQQSSGVSYWYQSVFGGFANNEDGSDRASLYASCAATDDGAAAVTLTRPSASFVPALSMVPFAMVSPTAAEKYGADDISGSADTPNLGTPFGTEHPTGTGPYVLTSWEKGQQIDLAVNEDYWGEAPEVERIVIQSLTDSTAKLQAFQSGSLDGYSNVPSADLTTLSSNSAASVYTAAPYTVGYVGFNSTVAPFDNPDVREAITHALDRGTVVSSMFGEGSAEADQLTPSATAGHTDDLPDQSYDPERAKQILADAGITDLTVDFAYPSGVSRPYMPNPSNMFQAFQENLSAVGITVNPVEIPWSQYSSQLLGGQLGMYLWGSVGSYPAASYFLSLYNSQTKLPAEIQTQVSTLLVEADSEQDETARVELFEQINSILMGAYVAVPVVEPATSTVLNARFGGYVPNAYGNMEFASLTLAD
jgi:peptide/nickel transport system substrate-binding protein